MGSNSGYLGRIIGYVELMRPHNLVATVLTTLVGILAASVYASISFSDITYLVKPVATVVLITSAGYVINDYYDAEVDAINKPYRPIPSGRVSKVEALVFSITLFMLGCLIPVFIGPLSLAYALINALLVYLYSFKIKELGFLGNLLVSFLGASSIIYGSIAVADYLGNYSLITASILPSTYAFLLLLSREVIKTIEDFRADSVRNVRSLPRTIGIKGAYLFSVCTLLLIVMISPLPYVLFNYGPTYALLVTITDAILIYDVATIIKNLSTTCKDVIKAEGLAARLRSHLKVAIFVGTLAFLTDLVIRYYLIM